MTTLGRTKPARVEARRRGTAPPAPEALEKVRLLGALGEELIAVRDDDKGLTGAITKLEELNEALDSSKIVLVLQCLERCSDALGVRSEAIDQVAGDVDELLDPDGEHPRPANLVKEINELLREHGEDNAEEDDKA
jgi:hypothetical protein